MLTRAYLTQPRPPQRFLRLFADQPDGLNATTPPHIIEHLKSGTLHNNTFHVAFENMSHLITFTSFHWRFMRNWDETIHLDDQFTDATCNKIAEAIIDSTRKHALLFDRGFVCLLDFNYLLGCVAVFQAGYLPIPAELKRIVVRFLVTTEATRGSGRC
jgi:hypothetical protein